MAACDVTNNSADPMRKGRWSRFHVWHLLLLVAVVASACTTIKYVIDFRAERAHFYAAIQSNRLSEVKTLLHRYPSLIRTTSPTLHVPGELSVYTRGESPVGVAVLCESRDTFDYLLSLHPDLNTRGGAGITPLIWATAAGDMHYLDALLQHGADCSVRDWQGKTALDHARQFGKHAFLDRIAEECVNEQGAANR